MLKQKYQPYTKSLQVAFICPTCNFANEKTMLIHKGEYYRLMLDPFKRHLFTHREELCSDCKIKGDQLLKDVLIKTALMDASLSSNITKFSYEDLMKIIDNEDN